MTRPQIVINVHGGVVQEVFASDRDLQVVLVDWDQEELDSSRPELVELVLQGHRAVALVCDMPVEPLSALAGSDVEQALEMAIQRGVLNDVVL